MTNATSEAWPDLPYAAWKDTCTTLQLWTQIVGKIRLAQTPWLNHSWHVTLYVIAARADHVRHSLWDAQLPDRFRFHRSCAADPAERRGIPPGDAAAENGGRVLRRNASRAGAAWLEVRINEKPNEIPDAIPFSRDSTHASYDRGLCQPFLAGAGAGRSVLSLFRTGFLGKVEPGAFLLGQLRSCGDALFRAAGAAASGRHSESARPVTREAYSHEVSSAGFWPGGGRDRLSRRSIPTPIRRRRVLHRRASSRRRPSSARSLANSCCPMTPCERQQTRKRR